MATSVVATCSGDGKKVISFRLGRKNNYSMGGGVVYQKHTLLTAHHPAFPGVMGQIA